MSLINKGLVLSTTIMLMTGCAAQSQYAKTTSVPMRASDLSQAEIVSTLKPDRTQPEPLIQLKRSSEFEQILEAAPGAVLVDFYADWCGPCRTQSGVMDEMKVVAKQNQASIVKVNIDQHPQLASLFEVTSLPTLMLMKDGQVLDRRQGLTSHEVVAELLRQ